ncbi:hypothetical protein EDB89DRAFT_1093382 [Lactarius sanguifluus]|nr:hypothetical protein EDB89DRAFT_1093382 [Lactarius sanguifluus]
MYGSRSETYSPPASSKHTQFGDYEEATAILERIVSPDHPGECPDSIQTRVQARLVTLAYARSEFFENPEYSELALARLRASQNSYAFDEELRIQSTDILAMQAEERFRHYGLAENHEEANSYISQVVDLSSSRSLERSGEFFIESAAVRGANPTTAIQQKNPASRRTTLQYTSGDVRPQTSPH